MNILMLNIRQKDLFFSVREVRPDSARPAQLLQSKEKETPTLTPMVQWPMSQWRQTCKLQA
jgi:hypothetical protein